MTNDGIVLFGAQQTTWEDDTVKWNVIFGHELEVLDLKTLRMTRSIGLFTPTDPEMRFDSRSLAL